MLNKIFPPLCNEKLLNTHIKDNTYPMKKNQNVALFKEAFLRPIQILFLIIIALAFTQQLMAQVMYKAMAASQIELITERPQQTPALQASVLSGEGKFDIKDGRLEHITGFKFLLPGQQHTSDIDGQVMLSDNIVFEQTHVMVLPLMGMVHFVGMLEIGGVRNRADFQLGFSVNEDNSIRLTGTKNIKLSDFYTNKEISLTDKVINELQLNITLILNAE